MKPGPLTVSPCVLHQQVSKLSVHQRQPAGLLRQTVGPDNLLVDASRTGLTISISNRFTVVLVLLWEGRMHILWSTVLYWCCLGIGVSYWSPFLSFQYIFQTDVCIWRKDCFLKKCFSGTSLVVLWLRLWVPSAGGSGLIPGQGTRSHMPQSTAKKKFKTLFFEHGFNLISAFIFQLNKKRLLNIFQDAHIWIYSWVLMCIPIIIHADAFDL